MSDKGGISQSASGAANQQAAIGNNNNQKQGVEASRSNTFNNELHGATIGNFANQVSDNAQIVALVYQ